MKRIKGSRLSVIDGQQHFPNVEVPNRFDGILWRDLDDMVNEVNWVDRAPMGPMAEPV